MITFERAAEGTYETILKHLKSGDTETVVAVGEIDLTVKIPTALFYATVTMTWTGDDLMQIAMHMVMLQRMNENES